MNHQQGGPRHVVHFDNGHITKNTVWQTCSGTQYNLQTRTDRNTTTEWDNLQPQPLPRGAASLQISSGSGFEYRAEDGQTPDETWT
jgi:hypothetical protein